ncbi:E3 ubiquitin-protein ligase rnf213-alpha-like [Clarias gariepinus]|uniref:E3 ubiquitin-protein ligase rnf213-alpha-like n=1 Tax=Clarias gariepinus TaxID=13013 RepID=UPI00234C816B|nr:E3 ubiquitin-protein ligase rnf213-alpha-like [Clarias gariepinus]
MQCPQCEFDLKATFRFCPECGQKLDTQPSRTTGGKSPEQLVHQGKERNQNLTDPNNDAHSPSEHCTKFPENRGKEKVISNPSQDQDGYASERTHNKISTVKEHVPQDGASWSSEKATEGKVCSSIDTLLQNKHTLPNVQDKMSSQSHQTSSLNFPSTQAMLGNTIGEKSMSDAQSFTAPPGIRSSSSEALSQGNVKPASVKCQLTQDHIEVEMNSSSSKPDPINNLKTESPKDDFLPPRLDQQLQSVQCTLSDAATQPQIKDLHDQKTPPRVNESKNVVITSQTQTSTAGILSHSCDSGTKVPVSSSHGDLAKAQTENLSQQSSVPMQPSNSLTTKNTKEETHLLQCTTGQDENQQSVFNSLVFGPYNNEEGAAAKPKVDNIGNKQQTKHKDVSAQKKEVNDPQKERGAAPPKQSFNIENPLPQEKNVPSDQNDEKGFQEVLSKEKKSNQKHTANQQQYSKDITIFFHAVLSKDFNIDPSRDTVTIRSGGLGGNWKKDILKMEITRDLGQDGFLVQGKLESSRKNVGNKCIPYKYVVLKPDKDPEHEYIYKDNAKGIVNRCLIIKESLLTQQGDWHQYDDIICTKPSHGMVEKIKNWFLNTKPDILRGRYIAGRIMLDTISDILSEWSELNVSNFMAQLEQFFKTYSDPHVYEEQGKRWDSLQYGENQVKELITHFMQDKIAFFQTCKNIQEIIQDQPRVMVILLLIYLKYNLYMDPKMVYDIGWLLQLPNLTKNEFISYWDVLLQPLPKERVAYAIIQFCQTAINLRTTNWILVLPFLHFLEKDSKPFEPNIPLTGQESEVWAGFKRLKNTNAHITDSEYTRALIKVMEAHKHLLVIDPLLIRSWMWVLGLNNLFEYTSFSPVDILDLLVMLNCRLDNKALFHNRDDLKQLLSELPDIIKNRQIRFKDKAYSDLCLTKCFSLLAKICRIFKSAYNSDVLLECLKLFNLIMDLGEYFSEKESAEAQREKNKKIFMQTERTVRDWLQNAFSEPLLDYSHGYTSFTNIREVETWSKVISLSFANEKFCSTWRDSFLLQFEGKLKQESPIHQIEIYCSQVEEVNFKYPVLSSSFEKCALEAVNSVCQNGSERTLFTKLRSHDFSKFGNLISAIVLKAWPKTEDGKYKEGEELVVKHLLTWPTASKIFQLQGAKGKLIDQLSDKARELMAMAGSAFSCVAQKFIQGDIKINILNQILEREDAFTELLRIDALCDDGRCKDNKAVKTLLRKRKDEIEDIYQEKEFIACLLRMCTKLQKHIEVDTEKLERNNTVNVEQMCLDEFMEVHQLDESSSDVTGLVTYFNLCDLTRKMAKRLHALRDSYIFSMCWENQAKTLSSIERDDDDDDDDPVKETEPCTLEFICAKIFVPCDKEFQSIYNSLRDGSITLQMVNSVFGVYKDNYEGLKKDLEIMCKIKPKNNRRWIKDRVHQIQQYHHIHLAAESAKVIMEIKETLCPEGNFNILNRLLEVSKADFMEASLDHIDDNLINAKTVLEDITESRRLCLQELSLRRNFAEWVKVALPDISQLKVFVDLASISAGENAMDVDRVACFHDVVQGYSSMLYGLSADSDFDAFKKALKKLWKALESDSNITKKLKDSARHLEWLKSVKESHGSVELSSISFATAINERGVYSITVQNQKKINMETALKLYVPEGLGKEQEIRCYSLEDVRDLQNKLMLMSGKAEHNNEVEHFTEVFDHVQRLAGIFLDLLSAGNPLFRNWDAKINCFVNSDHLTSHSIMIDFNLSSIPEKIAIDGNVIEHLPKLCRKMEQYLSDWRKFMEKQRSENYYLNYYTAEQIVYLCEQLSLKHLNEDLNECTLMMLSFINPKSSTSNVWKTWNLLFQDSDAMISEEGINGVQDVSDKDSGLSTLDFIWNRYITDMRTFLPDTLDISGLGKLLERMNSNLNLDYEDDDQEEYMSFDPDEEPKEIRRELPKGLMLGHPNLIVCPKEEILTTCLSVYAVSKYAPLPSYDEVLLCSSGTPYEQVELFLRRCLTTRNTGDKIYTLLYADLLSYEVSCAVEQLFNNLHSASRQDYKLVIICTMEQEHAYIPSAFSNFKLHLVPRESLERLQKYLCRHFTVPEEETSAATVFKDGQSVGIVSSKRAGVGKSLYVQRLYERLEASERPGTSCLKCIRLTESIIDESVILNSLLETPNQNGLVIFHFDVTTAVQKGLHEFLFKLLVLGYLMDTEGRMWKRSSQHLYVIEMLQHATEIPRSAARLDSNVAFTDVFPKVQCRPPKEVLELEMRIKDDPSFEIEDPLMDDEYFRSEAYQRPYQYLMRFQEGIDLDNFTFKGVEGSHAECLQMLFFYCGIADPSWAELRNFTWFLNLQLQDCETSVFCNMEIVGDTLRGFRKFVVDFMILMAKDFATPSLNISDQSLGRQQVHLMDANEEDLAPFRIRKRWESEPHPYIFFNDDHESMTFIGFHLRLNNENGVDAFDPSTNRVIRKNIMTKQLYFGLQGNKVPFNINFDDLPRSEKIEHLCSVLGVKWPSDPDETYQLTMDNVLKMMAIHMRFRCGIPVIIMGETGCGKTRLIKFMCELQRSGNPADNMKLVKVHGGTTPDIIYAKIQEAESVASWNKEKHDLDSVIFFDEANTTEAICCLKEVLCDNSVKGQKLQPNTGLHVIAACNPYRKHSDVMIKRLEGAGLGYIVKANQTQDKLGSIPLRQLVYRVHALPPSMLPLVWDFGQLDDNTEKMYIHQIVKSVVENNSIRNNYIKMLSDVLSESQCYMRKRKDERSFVSLRDVERCMQVFVWFYTNHQMFFEELEAFLKKKQKQLNTVVETMSKDPVEWSLLMAVAVCYHACLEKREQFWSILGSYFPSYVKQRKVMQEISQIQDLLLHDVPLGNTIAKNKALKENVFMMVVCIELRIPLFLVGKPGSSKSLSKTLVGDAMQGQAAHSELYRKLKQIHLTSYQCSPHSTAEGIINTFKQCARFQEGKNLKEYVSVVVLDEIGLAEDSPKMPLKTLHPLLEEGCIDDEPLPYKKVGFIGISNWALDPAKMNRGIFVSRGDPDKTELVETATGICSLQPVVLENIKHLFEPLAAAYHEICSSKSKSFFGLRDYYSLIKMLYGVSKNSNPSSEEIVHAVLRNFSGLDNVDALKIFAKSLHIKHCLNDLSSIDLVRQNITGKAQNEDCRYLLILTKNFAGLQILQQNIFMDNNPPEIIFGSSFPKDQEYTQVCKNINRVKICMETGKTVVLLNLQNLYESLYDALNQYYVFLGGQKYVDLGLGTHRVKCRVHKDFRLIVIEEKEVVYNQFPIPLINRLEKHYLDINSVLLSSQKETVKHLQSWVKHFVASKNQHSIPHKYMPQDVFIGYHSDTCSSVILQVVEKLRDDIEDADIQDNLLKEAKRVLLNCATPDSVVRLQYTNLPDVETGQLLNIYFEQQKHHSLAEFIVSHIPKGHHNNYIFTEVTTFSRLLTASDIKELEHKTGIYNIDHLLLQQFETEFSFLRKIRQFLETQGTDKILLVQMDFGEDSASANLLASARYSSMNEIIRSEHVEDCRVFVYFIIKLPRMEGGTFYTGFHGGHWMSVHIDDLRSSQEIVSDVQSLRNVSICELFEDITVETSVENSEDLTLYKEFDTTALLRSCVQSSVGMLRDFEDEGILSTKRVDILLTLLDNSDTLKVKFMKTLKKRLYLLLKTREDIADMPKTWVSREASNIEALQEGGTFKHTLWRRVQAVVTPLLAQLISVIDRNCNLDHLLDTNSEDEVKNLWLFIFEHKTLLDIPHDQTGSKSQTIHIQSHMSAGRTMFCAMPFSWRIKDMLDDLWDHTLQREDQSHKQFEEVFKRTVLGEYFATVDKKMLKEFFEKYLKDFVALTMKVSNVAEQKSLCTAMKSCVNEVCRRRGSSLETELSLPLVHTAYHEFQKRLQNFSRMISILPQVVMCLQGNPHVMQKAEMVSDMYGALACLEHLDPQDLNQDFSPKLWLKQVMKLQVPIEVVCSEQSLKQYGERSREMVKLIQNRWRRVFTLALFVEHILLDIEAVDERLKPLVMDCSRNLGKVLEKSSDMKLEKTFLAVIDILRSCKESASDLLFRFGLQTCPVCRVEPQDPVELPCNHVFCQSCIRRWLIPGQMYCAMCTQPVPDDFEQKVSEEYRTCLKLNAQFRQRCNAFFIEVVSTVCFKDNSPPSRAVILHLLSFLMVEAKPDSLSHAHSHIHTKALSPFNECVDRNPVIRSMVLKLLLKYSFDEVREYLEQHLTNILLSKILDGTDKTELYALYVNCFEDSMFEKKQLSCMEKERACLHEGRGVLHSVFHTNRVATEEISIESLKQIARLRICLDMGAQLLTTLPSSGSMEKHQEEFLATVMELCQKSKNDWYRVYLIRKICSLQGVEAARAMQKDAKFQWLFPQEIIPQEENEGHVDQYLVYGQDYKTVRESVAKAVIEGKAQIIDEAIETCTCSPKRKAFYILLALFQEVTSLFKAANPVLHPKPEQRQALEDYIHGLQYFTPEMKVFAETLVNNRLGNLSVDRHQSNTILILTELSIHLKAVLLCGIGGVLAPLLQLALSPATMQMAFIPTMPEDILATAKKALGYTWYTCPNGHPCVVDKCGKPTRMGRCLECGAPVGGLNHQPVQGFNKMRQEGDRSQRGHILGAPQRRDNPDALDTKSMSLTPFTLVRTITHMAMLLGASEQSQYIAQIIQPPVQDPCGFLISHLMKDLEHLGRALGKGVDDTVTTVHLMLSWTLEPPQNVQWPAGYDNILSTKEARNAWEITMAHNVITPKLKKLERKLVKVNDTMRGDARVSSDPILKLMYGDPRMFLSSLPQQSVLHSSAVWSCREKGSLLSLTHIVEQNDGKDYFPLLWKFLQKEPEFRQVSFLPDILALQRNLVKKFQNVPDLICGTIKDFINKQPSGSVKSWYEKRIKIFLSSWNQLRMSLANYEVSVPGDYCSVDLDEGSELQVLIPRRQGAGLCATALLSYLVSLHNQLVSEASQHTGESNRYVVSLAEVSDLHVIRYEVDRDLLPLVLSNCQYSMERGQETVSEYDLPKIQQQVFTRFLQGKPQITLAGIPTLVSRQERNYENIFKEIREKVAQEPLTSLSSTGLISELQSPSDVCETLSAVEVALDFLAMTGGDEHMYLEEYLEKRLHMENQTAPHILKALGRCSLKHCVSLWQLLTSLKSEHMLRLKRDPFLGIPASYRQVLGEKEKNFLINFLSKSSGDTWFLEMHEFLLLNLKSQRATDTYNPSWSIKETLATYMERKNLEVPLDVEEAFPDEIAMSQLVETWKFIVTYKQQR